MTVESPTTERSKVTVVPHFSRLHEWIALEEGLFEREGLDPELHPDVMHRVSSHAGDPYGSRPQDLPLLEPQGEVVNSACHWGSACNAGAGMGRFVTDLYTVGRFAIFARPGSSVERLTDLRDRPVGIGEMAGSHFTSLQTLATVLPREHIRLEYAGGPGRRLSSLLEGEVEAADLLDPEIPIAEAKGLRRLAQGEFMMTFWVSAGASPEVLGAFFRGLRTAEDLLAEERERFLPLWERNVPPELAGDWDYATFGRGEVLISEPYSEEMFEDAMTFAERWGLTGHIRERSYEALAAPVAL